MVFIGIDVAKRRHSAAAVDGEGRWLAERIEFANDREGFESFLGALRGRGVDFREATVCLEATGHYGINLIAYLQNAGFEVREVNPLLISNWRKTQSLRKVKNDAIDAKALATWISSGNPAPLKRPVEKRDDMRSLVRFRTSQVQIIGDSKRRAAAVIDRVFPEYHSMFSDMFGKASAAVLSRWPSAESLSSARVDAIERALIGAAGRRYGRADAQALKKLAASSVGCANATLEFELVELLRQIRFVQDGVKAVDERLKAMTARSPITTIPGVGTVCAAAILGEIGDISRFESPTKLVAFAGCDPTVHDSADFSGNRHLSKRGSRCLRHHLWLAADRARIYDPVIAAYYEKKRAEGKCHKVAISAVVRKLCAIIFSVLTTQKAYSRPAE